MLPKISELDGLRTCYANRSLRATAGMKMFPAGVQDKVIAEFTYHRSEGPISDIIIALIGIYTVDQMKTAVFAISGNAPNDRKHHVAMENSKMDIED